MAWLTAAEAREEPYWPKCDVFEDDALTLLLTSAREQCEDWAPVLADPDDPPERYRLAQAMQARALWRAQRSNVGEGGYGAEGMVVTIFPMDWTVKALLRPKKGSLSVR